MTRQHHGGGGDNQSLVRRFEDRERKILVKMFQQLGLDNDNVAEIARGRIDNLLRQFGKTWTDLIGLLSGGTITTVRAGLAGDVVALGSDDAVERGNARSRIFDLLARHRKNWADLVNALSVASPEPWACDPPVADPPRAVDLFGLVCSLIKEYVALRSPHEYTMLALWVLHTHAFRDFMVTPRLALRSPVAGCGKTTLMDILSKLTARAQKFDAITTAAICRLIDEDRPTLLIDEADNLGLLLGTAGKLRSIFNSGHRKGGTTALMEGGRLRRFETFAPMALALPDATAGLSRTLNSRTITLMMQRSDGQRPLRRFEANQPDPALDATYAQILSWRRDLPLLDLDPEMPAEVSNRHADNWRPLISIADNLGCGVQAREAMLTFIRDFQDADPRLVLLADIKKVFDAQAIDRMPTKTLLAALYDLADADWHEFRGVRDDRQPHRLKDSELAAMLREFQIVPQSIWPANRTPESRSAKGYRRAQFEEAWRAYCGEDGTAAQTSNVRSLRRP